MDNVAGHELTEGEMTLFGTSFGIVTDVQTAPSGNLFVVSLFNGKVYEIYQDCLAQDRARSKDTQVGQ